MRRPPCREGSSHPGSVAPVKDLLVGLVVDALDSVDPERLVAGAVADWHPPGRLVVLSIGKAAVPMLKGARSALEVHQAVAVAPSCGDEIDCLEASHPIPDASSEVAGRRVLEVARASGGSPVLVLLSGGASSLCEVPAEGVTLEDIAELSDRLLRCGAPIDVLNEVRSGLSAFKAGGLGGALADASEVRVLALSDVVGSAPETIGSGPTIARPFDPEGTTALAGRCGAGLPAGLAERLQGASPPVRATFPVEVLADGQVLADAVVSGAVAAGLESRIGSVLVGEASATARSLVMAAETGLTVHAGETTVTVTGDAPGGRNQEAALAAAEVLAGTDGIFVAIGSDGVDGTTDAAGAVVDGSTWAAIEASGLDPAALLAGNDAHRALDAVGALIHTGPTGTNVADVWAVWR